MSPIRLYDGGEEEFLSLKWFLAKSTLGSKTVIGIRGKAGIFSIQLEGRVDDGRR